MNLGISNLLARRGVITPGTSSSSGAARSSAAPEPRLVMKCRWRLDARGAGQSQPVIWNIAVAGIRASAATRRAREAMARASATVLRSFSGDTPLEGALFSAGGRGGQDGCGAVSTHPEVVGGLPTSTGCHPSESWQPNYRLVRAAKWVPAFAGMTSSLRIAAVVH